ncbi:Ribonuclease 3 [uncultured Paludibacter sp.]|uniref:Ribonuclease 3 n=1 Tax=uncultured Paludibacter sp. TaxID=497635 RepID=A0A653AH60_9BACT|nr:Ribonuclease 3 [uncultured Paludibacter sp.]
MGFFPKNIEYYQLAVRHRSKPIRTEDGTMLNNERLEFLGDAVLNSVVSDILYHSHSNEQEGFLTNARSRIVKRETLNQLCSEIKLDKLIVATKHLNLNKERNFNIKGNTLEALIGAIYLDYGYQPCKKFVKNKLFPLLEQLKPILDANDNPKSQIIEWCQKYHLQFDFILIDETVGANNQHNFISQLEIEKTTISRGNGASKKESQQNASLAALKRIQEEPDFLTQIQNQISD